MSKKIQFTITLLAGLVLSVSVQVVAAGSLKQYNITSYGAVGDGKTLNTLYIQAAIDACSKKGGGIVIIPTGKFITGAIFLKEGVSLYIEKNGVLKGSVNQSDYPQINTRWEGEERRMVPPVAPPAKVLPVVRNVRFIKITGNVNSLGMIHGLKDSPISDVKFKKCRISAQKGLTVDNVNDIDYSGLSAIVKEGQVIIKK